MGLGVVAYWPLGKQGQIQMGCCICELVDHQNKMHGGVHRGTHVFWFYKLLFYCPSRQC